MSSQKEQLQLQYAFWIFYRYIKFCNLQYLLKCSTEVVSLVKILTYLEAVRSGMVKWIQEYLVI